MEKFLFPETKATASSNVIHKLESDVPAQFQQCRKKFDDKFKSACFWRQLGILMWKNLLIIKRSYLQFILEITMSIFFIFMLLIVRYFVERIFYQEQSNSAYNVIDFFYKYVGQDTIIFYPDTPVVKNILNRAFLFLKSQKYWLSLNSA